jgi:predicted amidohydrolase
VKAGVAQIVLSYQIGSNVEKICNYINSAAGLKLDILCFPECSLTGYIRDFNRIGGGEIEKAIDMVHQQVMESRVNVILGTPYFEHDRLFNAAALLRVDRSRAFYNKHILTPFDERYFTPGKRRLSFEIHGIKCGILICRDQNSPMLAKRYAEKGVRAIFILAAHYYPLKEAEWKLDKNKALPIARAVENEVYVFKANAVGSLGNTVSLGGSIIVGPEGPVISQSDKTGEGILYSEVNS